MPSRPRPLTDTDLAAFTLAGRFHSAPRTRGGVRFEADGESGFGVGVDRTCVPAAACSLTNRVQAAPVVLCRETLVAARQPHARVLYTRAARTR